VLASDCGLLLHECRGRSVCLLVTFVSSAKTAEPIEMPFGRWLVGLPKEPCIRWEFRSQKGKGQFWGLSFPLKSTGGLLR